MIMKQHPKISIIIPVYNGEETIGPCLESLLEQEFPKNDYEIIVVDNNSNDQTKNIVNGFPVIYILENQRQGPSPARNRGAEIAKGSCFLFFDADQFAEKNYLKTMMMATHDSEFGAIAGRNIGLNSTNSYLGEYWQGEWDAKLTEGNIKSFIRFSGGNVLMKRDVFEKLGGFDEQLKTTEDTDLAWRIQNDLGLKIRYVPQAIAHHKERLSLKSLLKREFYFGFGGYRLGLKYQEVHKPILVSIGKALKRTVLGFFALIVKIIKLPIRKSRIIDVQLILLDIAMNWSNVFGRIYSVLTLNKTMQKTKPASC